MGKKIAANSNKDYKRLQIVARADRMGVVQDIVMQYPIFRYITFFMGKGPAQAAMFDRIAERDKDGFIRLEKMENGEIIVNPGLVYKKIPMTGNIMAAHLDAMRTFRPKDVIEYEQSKEEAIDVGVFDFSNQH